MIDINERKLELIQEVSQLWDERDLNELEETILLIKKRNTQSRNRKKPMPKKFNPEAVKRQRRFRSHDKNAFMSLVRELKVKEPVEVLLALLNK